MLRLRGILCAVLAILVVGLTPIAYADPPDPTWFGGYWDDDDFDNVVAFIASATAVVASPVIDGRPSVSQSTASSWLDLRPAQLRSPRSLRLVLRP